MVKSYTPPLCSPLTGNTILILKHTPDRLCVHHVKRHTHTQPCQGMIDFSKMVLLNRVVWIVLTPKTICLKK